MAVGKTASVTSSVIVPPQLERWTWRCDLYVT
jgi:hypothetical protein